MESVWKGDNEKTIDYICSEEVGINDKLDPSRYITKRK